MSRVPVQKPGRSEQVVCTPVLFLEAVKKRLRIKDFVWDLAASHENKVCDSCYTEEDDALIQPWNRVQGWNWCNPPFSGLEDWTSKASKESFKGAQTVMLVPASVGSNWWREWAEPYAYQTFLNGRVTFVGHTSPYPKDLALLLYTPWRFTGSEIWQWRGTL